MITLSTDSLKGYGLNRVFGFIKEAGYDGVDLAIDPNNFDTMNVEYIEQLVKETGLPIVSIQLPMKANPKRVEEALEMAKELGVKIIIVQPPKLLDFKFIKWLSREVPKLRAKYEMSIALENAPSDTFLGIIPEHAMGNLNELRKFKHACLDTTRVAMKKEDLIRVLSLLKKFLVHIHVSNVKQGKGYRMPESGVLPLESFLTKLKQVHYKGAISFKVLPKFLGAGNDKRVLKNLKACKDFYAEYFLNAAAGADEEENEEDNKD